MSSVTDRPVASPCGEVSRQTATIVSETSSASLLENVSNAEVNTNRARSVSADIFTPTVDESSPSRIVPSDLRPSPTAALHKSTQQGRKKGRTKVLTDTPEKQAVEQEAIERLARRSQKKGPCSALKTTATTRPKKKRRLLKDSSSSSEEETVAVVFDDSDSNMSGFGNEKPDISEVDWPNEPVQVTRGDFVLVRFGKKKSDIYYTGSREQ